MTLMENCIGADNVGTMIKNDKVFQLSGIYQKDVTIIPDIKIKNHMWMKILFNLLFRVKGLPLDA